ncbi:MAG: sulfite exporter TauE/SafE family protein [Flavipsychrobacter sp.]|nr:sulfite exporter TauE/SafE family protein [Flavipsychrobacter sp.]
MNTLTFTLAFVMGFTGSLHCAGMCGPIIWVMPFQFLNGFKRGLGIFLYHFGRVSMYALLALILHSFKNLFQPQIQQYISLILGGTLLVAGMVSFIPSKKVRFSLPWSGYIQTQLGKFMSKPQVGTLLITGVLNGLLPCGLVYMALSASIATPSSLQATLMMYSFGLGTMPMLLTLTLLRKRVSLAQFGSLKRMVPVMMFVFGCLFMLRGMNLGIPYLSPRIEVTQHEVKASCCHKNSVMLKIK